MINDGFFEIGIYHPKTTENVGTLWRSAYQMGAYGIYTIGRRIKTQPSDTTKSWTRIPYRNFDNFEQFNNSRPVGVPLVGIEMGGVQLSTFSHPNNAIYLLGAEDHGLPPAIQDKCQFIININSVRSSSYNVAVAGSLVMFDRMCKL